MLNQKSIESVNASVFSNTFRKPLYETYNFANIPGTIERLLCGNTSLHTLPHDTLPDPQMQYDKVILFFVDAFGWRFFERYKDKYPVLQNILAKGVASKITSQFPSTTAAHVTTIHTSLRVDESGIFEWFYYEPKLDAMIAPLLFSYAGDNERGSLIQAGVDPKELYPNHSFYKQLEQMGVKTHLFQSKNFTPSPYGNVVTDGVREVFAFEDLSSALISLRNAITNDTQKAYYYFYYGQIDHAGHHYGPDSPEFESEVDAFFTQLENLFIQEKEGNCGKTLLLMTADHGQTNIDPTSTIYLNQALPQIIDWTRTNEKGDLLVPGGSCRDMFLYIKEEHLATALLELQKFLSGKAEVYLVDDLIQQGFFGDNPSALLKERIGNICILPYAHDSVFWWEEGRFEQNFYGHHGGLTPAEMESIFLAVEL